MSQHPSRPLLKSITPTPADLPAAEPAASEAVVGEPKGAARKGVVTALRSAPHSSPQGRPTGEDLTPDQPGIRIYAPPVYRHHYDGARWSTRHGDIPTAAYACACGQTGTVTGPRAVAALVAEYEAHASVCTGTPAPLMERRNAA